MRLRTHYLVCPFSFVSVVPDGCNLSKFLKLSRLRVFTIPHGNPFIKLLLLRVPVMGVNHGSVSSRNDSVLRTMSNLCLF